MLQKLTLGYLLSPRTGPLADAEDDKLSRLYRGHANFSDHLSQVAHVGRVGLSVALDIKSFLGG